MKKISLIVDKPFQNNKIFNIDHPSTVKYRSLKKQFAIYDFSLNTCGYHRDEDLSMAIYFDIPDNFLEIYNPNINNYALLIESPLIKPNNLNQSLYKYFEKIFTWSDDLIDQYKQKNKFIKINYAFDFKNKLTFNPSKKEKLCSLIVANKYSDHKNELYSKRREVVRWFEQNHPNEFDLYGRDWNRPYSGNRVVNKIAKIKFLSTIFMKVKGNYFSSYCGTVENKQRVLSKYKFTFAYENIQNSSGYITEKIFDAFFAGCVPIYLGADNVTMYIPEHCFIDKRKFKSYDDLYNFITSIREDDYLKYLNNIEQFLRSNEAKQFSISKFVDTIVSEIVESYHETDSSSALHN